MIGTLAYLVALNAPEIVVATAEAGGSLAQAAGRNFAKGLADELSSRLSSNAGPLATSFLGALGGGSDAISKSIRESVETGMSNALKATNVALVDAKEIELLREMATEAATSGDVQAVMAKLKAFHAAQKL